MFHRIAAGASLLALALAGCVQPGPVTPENTASSASADTIRVDPQAAQRLQMRFHGHMAEAFGFVTPAAPANPATEITAVQAPRLPLAAEEIALRQRAHGDGPIMLHAPAVIAHGGAR